MAFLSFPLFHADGRAAVPLRPEARAALRSFAEREAVGAYQWMPVLCLCGEPHPQDRVITEKDRYGLSVASVACGRCGLVRSAKALDPASMALFYARDYRSIYEVDDLPTFFAGQLARGQALVDYAKPFLKAGAGVFEVGCGAGGVVGAFKQAGYSAAGCDFDPRYLDYGRAQGLDLRQGAFAAVGAGSPDAIILCHVLEHFLDPVAELTGLVQGLPDGACLVIEVPGLYALPKGYPDVLGYFQSAHIYNYGREHLAGLLRGLGLELLASDESCRAVARRPEGWRAPRWEGLRFDGMAVSAARTPRLLGWAALSYRLGLSPWALYHHGMRLRRALGARLRRTLRRKANP